MMGKALSDLSCLQTAVVFSNSNSEFQIRRSTEDNSKIIFLIFQRKHML